MALSSGPTVVLTRQSEDNRPLAAALAARGVPVVEIPCVATRFCTPARLPRRVDAVTFSSKRGVDGLVRAGLVERLLGGERRPLVAAVGRSTAHELRANGIEVDLVADPPEGRALAALLAGALAPGAKVATVRGDLRAGDLDEALLRAGFALEPVEVYQNVAPAIPRLEPFAVAAVFVASPSAGRRLLAVNPWLRDTPFYVIGQTTHAALEALGVAAIVRMGADFAGWVDALCSVGDRTVEEEQS